MSAAIIASAEDGDVCCWICLGQQNLERLCNCPERWVHKDCLFKWQLHCAGKSKEESQCRFCNSQLPSWKDAISIPDEQNQQSLNVVIKHAGSKWRLQIPNTYEGRRKLQCFINHITGQSINTLSTIVNVPTQEGDDVQFEGAAQMEAALSYAAFVKAQKAT